MTASEFEALVHRFSVEGFPIPMKVETRRDYEPELVVQVYLRCQVPERDQPSCDTFVRHSHMFTLADFEHMHEELAISIIRDFFVRCVVHELDEFLKVDGVRRWDPHK